MADLTTRLTGHGGIAHVGATAGASDIYNSADIEEGTCDFNTDREDMSGKNDLERIIQWTRRGATGTIRKMVATAVFMARWATDPVVYLTLKNGVGPGGTIGSGAHTISGLALITGGGYNSPNAAKEVENLTFEFSGTITVT